MVDPTMETLEAAAASLGTSLMSIDDIVRDLADAGNTLPEAAMRAALENWEIAAPRFVELLNRCADGADRSEATKSALFFIVHLLGEKREAEAFPALCRLLEIADLAESVLDDAITDTLPSVIISTYNGDSDALKRLIESIEADEFVRAAALDAMAYLTRTGAFTDDEMRAYLRHLRTEMRPQSDCYVWSTWADAVANLGYSDYAGEVETLISRGFVPEYAMDMDDFTIQLRRTLDDPEGLGGFEFDQIRPFSDTIGTLSAWHGFSEEFRLERERLAARQEEAPLLLSANEPYVNPLRHIGRNDPCPCGSGKKYKKCCLQ